MQSFSLIKNALMQEIDSNAVEIQPPKPLKNTLKTLVKISNPKNFSTGVLYNKRFTFDIPKEYDNLSQLYIKATLSTNSTASTVETYLAAKLLREINLRTKQGTILQTILPFYTHMRIDEIYGSELYNCIAQGTEPDITFASGSPTCFIPLFYFFSESLYTSLSTRSLEPLEIECLTNFDKGTMGLSVDLTSATFELYALYHDENTSSAITDKSYTLKHDIPKHLYGSYNIFQEDSQVVLATSTTARLLLRCPFPLFALHASLVAADSTRTLIKTMKLTVGGVEILNMDYRINYQNFGNHNSFLENGTTSYFFSRNKARDADSGLIVFSKSMFPCYLDVTFDALAADSTLNIFEEIRTHFEISPEGKIGLNTSDQEGTLQQLNSSTQPANLLGTN
jgi:hypothetical protein